MITVQRVRLFDLSPLFSDHEVKAVIGFFQGRGKNAIAEERVHLAEKAGFATDNSAYGYQIHSAIINIVNASGFAGEGDGLITSNPDIVLTIQVADCVPLFIHSKNSHVQGLFHVGWRGAVKGIVKEGIDHMVEKLAVKPEKMEAVLGPSIGSCCYQIRKDVANYFPYKFLTRENEEHFYLDLPGFVKSALIDSGLSKDNVKEDGHCTFCSKENFHSFRRDGEKAGRILCFLGRR
ncbi:MAG: peptidoglycan editing factor PgeF [Fidelibacterota bacterium]